MTWTWACLCQQLSADQVKTWQMESTCQNTIAWEFLCFFKGLVVMSISQSVYAGLAFPGDAISILDVPCEVTSQDLNQCVQYKFIFLKGNNYSNCFKIILWLRLYFYRHIVEWFISLHNMYHCNMNFASISHLSIIYSLPPIDSTGQ